MRKRLEAIVGPDRVVTDPAELEALRDDFTGEVGAPPLAAVRPCSTEEVQALVRWAGEGGVPLVPRVANTNVGGLALPVPGCVVVDLSRMDRILEVDAEARVAVVEPGVTQQGLKDELARRGLPLTLGFSLGPPWASVLANCILDGLTNRSLALGSMGQALTGLEVVLGDGRVVRTGSWAVRGVAPWGRPPLPDLTGLFVSFQGTTGIVTRAAVALLPRPPVEKRLFVLGYASSGVFGAMRSLAASGCCEDVGGLSWPTARMMLGVPHPHPEPDPGEPRWFLYVDLAGGDADELAYKESRLRRILDEARAHGERFEDPLPVRDLLALDPALGAFAEFPTELEFLTRPPGGGLAWMGTYGPLARFEAVAEACGAAMASHGWAPAVVSRAMAGGRFGVLRFLVTFDRHDPAETARVQTLMEELLERVTEAGFLMYKTPPWALRRLAPRIDPVFLDLARQVQTLLDPHGILNPGRWRP